MSNTKTVPTEPGAYYLDNGQPAVVWPSCGSLLCRGESVEWVDSAATTWATGPDGGPVRVPTWEEWGEAVGQMRLLDWWRNRANELVAQQNAAHQDANQARAERDAAIAERDEARAALDALLSALAVPEGADPVEWAGLLAEGARMCRREHSETVVSPGRRWAEQVIALRTSPRHLPDGPGWWWAVSGGEDVPVRVAHECGLMAGELRDSVWQNVASDAWTWLVGPDGKAVRCTPPEVTRD